MINLEDCVGKNKINEIKKQIQKHDKYYSKVGKLENDIINNVFDAYNSDIQRNALLEQAKTFNYSRSKLEIIENVFNDYNLDNIDYNIATEIMDAQIFIDERTKESMLSKIGNLVTPN